MRAGMHECGTERGTELRGSNLVAVALTEHIKVNLTRVKSKECSSAEIAKLITVRLGPGQLHKWMLFPHLVQNFFCCHL